MIKSEYLVTLEISERKTYHIFTKDEDAATIIAKSRFEQGQPTSFATKCSVEVYGIKKVSPRYIVDYETPNEVRVYDTEARIHVAVCYSRGVAEITAKALNGGGEQ